MEGRGGVMVAAVVALAAASRRARDSRISARKSPDSMGFIKKFQKCILITMTYGVPPL